MSQPRSYVSLPRSAGVAALALACLAIPARAQFGGGYGFGLFQYRAPSVDMLNQRAMVAAGASYARQANMNLTAPQNRYTYRDQAIAFQDRYDFQSRSSVGDRRGRPANRRGTPIASTARPSATPPAAATPSRSAAPAITSFINAARRVLWPADSPLEGDLGTKRQASDQATLRVIDEYQSQGSAAITTVAEARKELVDYGQPALQYLRTNSSPAIANSFHTFLLALYDSLAEAARRDGPPPIPRNP